VVVSHSPAVLGGVLLKEMHDRFPGPNVGFELADPTAARQSHPEKQYPVGYLDLALLLARLR
jgi:hypothetical protein